MPVESPQQTARMHSDSFLSAKTSSHSILLPDYRINKAMQADPAKSIDFQEDLEVKDVKFENKITVKVCDTDAAITERGQEGESTHMMESRISFASLSNISSSDDLVVSMLVSHLQSAAQEKQRAASAQLRLLTKSDERKRELIVHKGALPHLIILLQQSCDRDIQTDSITTILNLSLNPDIRPVIVEQGAILSLISVVECGMSSEAMENAALALANLAAVEEYKSRIGSAGAIPPLAGLLHNGTWRGKKDAATAIYMLSSNSENKRRIIRAGILIFLLDFLSEQVDGLVDKSLAILTNLVTIDEGKVALIKGGINPLMQVIQGTGSHIGREMAISIVLLLCNSCNGYKAFVLQEDPIPLLQALSERGNPRIKSKAAQLFCILHKHADLQLKKANSLQGQ